MCENATFIGDRWGDVDDRRVGGVSTEMKVGAAIVDDRLKHAGIGMKAVGELIVSFVSKEDQGSWGGTRGATDGR